VTFRQVGLCVCVALTAACGVREKVVMLYPEHGPGAEDVAQVVFTQQITAFDNFVLRPEEFAAVTPDSRRNRVYVGGREGRLLALDADSGVVLWEHQVTGAIASEGVLTDDNTQLIFGTDNGEVLALDLESHEVAWSFHTDGRVRNAPVLGDGVVYIANSRDEIFALSLADGGWRWQWSREFQTDFTVHGRAGLKLRAAPERDGATLFTGFDDGSAVALDATLGTPLWITSVAPPEGGPFVDCDTTPLVDEGHQEVVVAGQATGVYGLGLEEGDQRWFFPVRGVSAIAAAPEDTTLVTSALQGVYRIDREGHELWRQQLDPGVLSRPVLIGNAVFVTHSAVGLVVLDARDGEILAGLDPGSGISSTPVYDATAGRFYATSNRGLLLAMRVQPS